MLQQPLPAPARALAPLSEGSPVDLHYVIRHAGDGRVLASTQELTFEGAQVGGLGVPARISLLRHWDGARGSLTQGAGAAGDEDEEDLGVLPARVHACLASMSVGETARFWLPLDPAADATARRWLGRGVHEGLAGRGRLAVEGLPEGLAGGASAVHIVLDASLLACGAPLPPIPSRADLARARAAAEAARAARAADAPSIQERCLRAGSLRAAGNAAFAAGDWRAAVRRYGEAFAVLTVSSDEVAHLTATHSDSAGAAQQLAAATPATGAQQRGERAELPMELALLLAAARLPLFCNRAQAHLLSAGEGGGKEKAGREEGARAGAAPCGEGARGPPLSGDPAEGAACERATPVLSPQEEQERQSALGAAVHDTTQALAIVAELYQQIMRAGGSQEGQRSAATGKLAALPLSSVAMYHARALQRRARARLASTELMLERERARPRRFWDPDRCRWLLAAAQGDAAQLAAAVGRAQAAEAEGERSAPKEDGGAAPLLRRAALLRARVDRLDAAAAAQAGAAVRGILVSAAPRGEPQGGAQAHSGASLVAPGQDEEESERLPPLPALE